MDSLFVEKGNCSLSIQEDSDGGVVVLFMVGNDTYQLLKIELDPSIKLRERAKSVVSILESNRTIFDVEQNMQSPLIELIGMASSYYILNPT